MGDAQSAQRDGKKDAAAEEESGKVDDAPTEQKIEDKPLKNNGQISEINGKADGSIAEVNGHCEDEIAPEAILSPDKAVLETEKPLQEEEEEEEVEEETPLDKVEINNKETDANDDVPVEMTELDAKQNDINEGFRKFFSNIGLKLTVKRGSIATDVPEETNKTEPKIPEDVEDTAEENISENADQTVDMKTAQETNDNDSTTCPTLTEVTSEDAPENAEEKTTETKEKDETDNADAATTSPVEEDEHQDATDGEEPQPTHSPEEEVVSPIKRFFTTGIFSGLRKKKRTEDETTEKELVDMGKKEITETTDETVQDQQHDEEGISKGVEEENKENEPKEDIQSAASAQTTDEGKSSSTDPSAAIVTQLEILSSQERDKVQASPLKRLLSGSSLKKHSKKQKSRKSSDAKLSDSGEHVSDQLLSSTESAENHQKEKSPVEVAVEEEESAWTAFKKLMTPKKRIKRPSGNNEETPIPVPVEEPKPSEGQQISDNSTEEGKKRKDSSVSWDAVLCGSGRRRSRKTSDSEDETPQVDDQKQDSGSKHGAESPIESSNEGEGDTGSTWKSLKRLVTPKRKAKDEDESKDNAQSDSEVTQDDSSFSIKKLLPGRKKRKSVEKQDQVSSDEADKDVASIDEDSETPAVVPLSEFDLPETAIELQTQADIECHKPEDADYELQQDLLDQMAEPALPADGLQTEANKVQDNDDASTIPAANEEPDDLTDSLSKHQQLSDIPEEGIITETMATPASMTEEAARDDTIADDLIEITSEAITAPEPASDITPADETEMISAVSQLSTESSKTSGNTTPVPAEYNVEETDTLLHQVVETIYTSPTTVSLYTEELSSKKLVGSVSHQILETFVKEEPTILEIHRKSDATAIKTGLHVEELDVINELAATPQTESLSEVNDSVSTEVVSEVPTEEFDTAEISVDEVHEIRITHPEKSLKELGETDESHDLDLECQSEVKASTDLLKDETEPQELDSAATVMDETKDVATEENVQTVTEEEDQVMHGINEEIEVEDKEQPQLEAAQADDSEDARVQSLEQEVISEDIPGAETLELKEETEPITEVSDEPEKGDEPETEAVETQLVQVPETSEAAKERSALLPEEEEKKLDEIPPAETETLTDEHEAKDLTEVSAEPENNEELVDAVKSEHDQEPELLEAVQTPTSLDMESTSEDVPKAEDEPIEEIISPTEVNLQSVDASKTEHVQEPEVLQAVQEATHNLEASVKEVISEDISGLETVTDEPNQETEERVEPEEELPVEAAKTEHVHETEELPCEVQDIVTETQSEEEALVDGNVIAESTEDSGVQLEKQTPDAITATASVTDETQSEVAAQLDEALDKMEDQKTEVTPQDVRVENEESIPDVVDELQTLTAVHVPSVIEEASNVQVLGKTIFSEDTSAPCVDSAAVTDESKHEVYLSEVQVSAEAEVESELPGIEPKTSAVEHAEVVEVSTCDVKDASTVAIPDVLIEKTSEVTEPLISTVANEQMVMGEVEAAAPLEGDDMPVTTQEGNIVVMMHAPSVMSEDNHRIQVQVVDVDIKSADKVVDSVLEVGITETKEVIDVCHETVEKVENLSATAGIEKEVIDDENKVTVEEVIQHTKENLPETIPESKLESNLEEEVIEKPDAVTKVSEMVETESTEDQKAEEDAETFVETQDEVPVVPGEGSASEQQVSEELEQTPDISGSVDSSIVDHKEDFEKSEGVVTAEEVTLQTSEELDVKKFQDQAPTAPTAQSVIAAPSNTGLVVPQNTGIIQSIGNVESPSSLSLEFKLNIQFGQTRAPTYPPPATERAAPATQTDVSEVGVQAVVAEEPVQSINPTRGAESQTQTEVSNPITEPSANLDSTEEAVTQPVQQDVGIQAKEIQDQTTSTERITSSVQTTEIVESAANLNSAERDAITAQPVLQEVGIQANETVEQTTSTESVSAGVQTAEVTEPVANLISAEGAVIATQPILQDVGIQAMETVEPEQKITPTETVTCSVQATETVQPVRPTEEREVLSQPLLSEACDPKTEAEEENIKPPEEENDQDVWMDAEEVIYTPEETVESFLEAEEPPKPTDGEQEEEARLGQEVEIAPDCKTEEEESQQETNQTRGTCDVESEGEDFAVALEDLEIPTASVTTTMEWD